MTGSDPPPLWPRSRGQRPLGVASDRAWRRLRQRGAGPGQRGRRFRCATDPIEVDTRWLYGREEAGALGFGVRFDGLRARDAWALTRFLDAAA